MRRIIYFVFFLILNLNSAAQTGILEDTIGFDYTIQVIEVRGNSVSLPISVSKIDRSQILQNTGITSEPLFQQMPGIWMQTGAPNTNRMSIRGVGNREPFATSKLKVYLGEIPLTNGVGESSIEDIDPLMFQSIEVYKSPTSALWGNGLGGMIQLKPSWNDPYSVRFSSQIGSFGQWNSSLLFHQKYGENQQHQTKVHFQHVTQNGYRENNNYSKQSGTFMQKISPNEKLQFQFFTHVIKLKAQIPSSLGISDFTEHPEKAAFTWANVKGNEDYIKGIFGVSGRYIFNEKLSYQASLFGNIFDSDEVRPFNVLHEKNGSIGTRQRGVFAFNQDDFLSIGFEYFNEKYEAVTFETLDQGQSGGQLSDETEKRNHWYTFLQYQNQLSNQFNLLLGLSYTTIQQNNGFEPFKQSDLSPTFGIVYSSPIDGLVFKGSISKGFSPINLSNALGSDGIINKDLNPEKGWSSEITGVYNSVDEKLNGSITFYRMRITDLFVQKRIAEDQFIGSNAGRSKHDGIELEFQFKPNKKLMWQSSYTLSNHHFGVFIDGEDDYSGNKLTGTAPHILFNQLTYQFTNRFSTRLTHRFVSKTVINDNNTVYGNGYQIFHSGLQFGPIAKKNFALNILAGVNNIFDVKYASMFQINARAFGTNEARFYYAGQPRNYYLKLVLNIQ